MYERVGKNLLYTVLLGYPAGIPGALARAKIIFAQPRPQPDLWHRCHITTRWTGTSEVAYLFKLGIRKIAGRVQVAKPAIVRPTGRWRDRNGA